MTAFSLGTPCKPRHGDSVRIVRWIACVLFLLTGFAPSLHGAAQAAQSASSSTNSNAQNPASSDAAYQKYLLERRDVDKYRRKQERKEEIKQSHADNPEAHDDADQYRHSATVQNIAHHLGMSTETTARIFESFNFLILLAAVVWFVARALPKTLRSRKERIQNEIERARAATEDANRRLAIVEQRLGKLDEEINSLQTRAQQETAAEERSLRAALEEEKQRIVDAAAKEVDAASMNAQRELKNLTAELVIEHARRGMAVNLETDRLLVDAFVADLPNDRSSGVN